MIKSNNSSQEVNKISGEVLYSWDATTPSQYFGAVGKYIQWGVPMLVFTFLICMGLTAISIIPVFVSFYFIVCLFLVLIYRYTTFSDYHCHYEILSSGIKEVRWQVIPIWLIKLVRIFAWSSVLIVILSVAIIGPLSLAGGAVFVFSLFKFRSYSADSDSWFTPFSEKNIVFYLERNQFISLYAYPYKNGTTARLFVNKNNNEVINKLKEVINCEVYTVKNIREREEHPRMKDIVNTIKVNEKN